MPFLKSAIGEYSDEILHAIAKACGSIVAACGGGGNAACLLPLLETLCEHEETVVRNNVREMPPDPRPMLPFPCDETVRRLCRPCVPRLALLSLW